jgi:hypothetical protein
MSMTAAPTASTTFATTVNTRTDTDTETQAQAQSARKPLWRVGARSGVIAAVATTVIAAVALAADVPLAVSGEQIPVPGFAQMTLLGAALGVVLAKALVRWTARPARNFVAATVSLTAASIVPDLTVDASTASRLVLIATHVVAAAIVIPALARRLPANSSPDAR